MNSGGKNIERSRRRWEVNITMDLEKIVEKLLIML
jgi:hypothetical protein